MPMPGRVLCISILDYDHKEYRCIYFHLLQYHLATHVDFLLPKLRSAKVCYLGITFSSCRGEGAAR